MRFNNASPRAIASNVRATVKWFNPAKGFGFVAPDDRSGDVYLSAEVLGRVGREELREGAVILCDVTNSPKGRQIAVIHRIESEPEAPPPRAAAPVRDRFPAYPDRRPPDRDRGFGDRPPRYDQPRPQSPRHDQPRHQGGAAAGSVEGTVRWYNPDKGYGFIQPDNGGKDVFVHATALTRSNLQTLADQQRVRIETRAGPKGLEAVTVTVL